MHEFDESTADRGSEEANGSDVVVAEVQSAPQEAASTTVSNGRHLTTGQVAKVCGFSQQHAIRCTETGQLKFFYLPGSTHRRITRAVLEKFMDDNGIPKDRLSLLDAPKPKRTRKKSEEPTA